MNKEKNHKHSSKNSQRNGILSKIRKNIFLIGVITSIIGGIIVIMIFNPDLFSVFFKKLISVIISPALIFSDFLRSSSAILVFYILFSYLIVSIFLIIKFWKQGCTLYDNKNHKCHLGASIPENMDDVEIEKILKGFQKCILYDYTDHKCHLGASIAENMDDVEIEKILKGFQRCTLYDYTNHKCSLGIIGIEERDDVKIEAVLQRAKNSYNWVGLSAINDISLTDPQIIIQKAAKKGTKFSYILLSPDDIIRVKDQYKWEKGKDRARVVDIKDNIETSRRILEGNLAETGNVSVRFSNRLPWLRVTQIDGSFSHVAHYDYQGCGFYGKILVIGDENERNSDQSEKDKQEPLLVTWLKHFILTEHKNALIDDIYADISRYYCKGYKGDELVDKILKGSEFKSIRSDFSEVFQWDLDKETILKSIEYVIQRYGLPKRCKGYRIEDSNCPLKVDSVVPTGRQTFSDIEESTRLIRYFGATGYWPARAIWSPNFFSKLKKNPNQYTIRFMANHPGSTALKISELIFNRKHDNEIPDGYTIESEPLFKFLKNKQANKNKSHLIFHDFIPAFRIVEIDEKMYISFYQEDNYIKKTPVLLLKKKDNHDEEEISLYEWFHKFLERMEYTNTMWDIEREIWHRWSQSKTPPGEENQLDSLIKFAFELFRERGLNVNGDNIEKITNEIVQCVKKYQIKRNSMILANVKAILFDVGDTLYMSKEFDKQFTFQIEKLLSGKLNITLKDAQERLKKKREELLKKENDSSKVRAMAAFGINRPEVHEAFCKVNPGLYLSPSRAVNDMLKNLHGKGYKLAILSNFRKILVEQIMNCLDIDLNVFDFLITEDDGLPIKPAKDPFIESLKRFGLEAKNVAYVGDDLSKDMEPAKDVEMRTVWANPKPTEGPWPKSVDVIIKDVLELNDIFCK